MITHGQLLDALRYDPDTGHFYWKIKNSWLTEIGQIAGTRMKRGYWKITVCGYSGYAHRLAWFYVHGRWPKGQIDHINRNRLDNRICNLREANQQGNSANMFRARQNTSGFKGVYALKNSKRFMAAIRFNGKSMYLGLYDTKEEAAAAYKAKAQELFGGFAQ